MNIKSGHARERHKVLTHLQPPNTLYVILLDVYSWTGPFVMAGIKWTDLAALLKAIKE